MQFVFTDLKFILKDENLHLPLPDQGHLLNILEHFNFLIRYKASVWVVCTCFFILFIVFFFVYPCVYSMGPDTPSMVIDAHDCRQALGDAGPLLMGIKARGIWLYQSSEKLKVA